MSFKKVLSSMFAVVALALTVGAFALAQEKTPPADIEGSLKKLAQESKEAHWKNLWQESQRLLDAIPADDVRAGEIWNHLVTGLEKNNEIDQYEAFFEKYAVKKFADNIAFFATMRTTNIHNGYILNGKFNRGHARGNMDKYIYCNRQDQMRQMQLMNRLMVRLDDPSWKIPAGQEKLINTFYMHLYYSILRSEETFELQRLTDLSKSPDYSEPENRTYSYSRPPVNKDGTPVFYKAPESWAKAASDGERLRYLLKQVEKTDWKVAMRVHADFLCDQFDLSATGHGQVAEFYTSVKTRESLYNLPDNETIADLANGIHKITLPDEFNYLEMYKKLGNHNMLAKIYLSRLQFERAAKELEQTDNGQETVEQIRRNWGIVSELLTIQPLGAELTIPYRFRNAKKVTVKLYRVKTEAALERTLKDAKDAEKEQFELNDLAGMGSEQRKKYKLDSLIEGKPEKVLMFDLSPLPHHWETQTHLKFGKMNAGAYVAKFTPEDNAKSEVDALIWIADQVLTSDCSGDKVRLYLNQPITGAPIANREIKIHSYYWKYTHDWKLSPRMDVKCDVATFKTDGNGIVEFDYDALKHPDGYVLARRLVVSESSSGKTTLLTGLYCEKPWRDHKDSNVKTFFITDKTVYKPGDKFAITGYVREGTYADRIYKGKKETVKLLFRDPQGKDAFTKEVPYDAATQSFTAEVTLPEDAMLGQWTVTADTVQRYYYESTCSFSVEEYKKPEYLLSVKPPEKPVKLGSKIPVTIEAKYYFGAPLVNADVKYRVYREEANPVYPFHFFWSWLYGEFYAFCNRNFGETESRTYNYGRATVLDTTGKTDAKGQLTFEIDSADALGKYGGRNFRYTVSAEVADSTNRIVSGEGSVIAAAKPFDVTIYTPWGYAKTGERQQVQIAARTANGEKVQGQGVLRVFRRAINDKGVPGRVGDVLKSIPFDPNGPERTDIILNEEGVYELDAEVISEAGDSVHQTARIFVVGEKQGEQLFGEYPISISTDKPTYQPGETAHILISCNQPNRTVYLVTRAERGAAIQCVTLTGYSKLFDVKIEKDDQPNFFVYALSVQDGKMLTLEKKIIVPPEKKALNVQAKPEREKVKPATTLPVKIAVTGLDGKPVSGAVTVAVYDKSLEAVRSSRIPEILPFFWSWTRSFSLQLWNNLNIPCDSWYADPGMRSEPWFGATYRRYPNTRLYGGVGRSRMRNEMGVCYAAPADGVCAAPAMKRSAPLAMGAGVKTKQFVEMKSAAAPMDAMEGAAPAMGEEPAVSPVVRTNFLDRAFWAGRIVLPESGETTVDIPIPDNLTTWVIRVWSLTPDTQVGEARTEIIVSKDLIARLEIPRLMVQGDTVNAVISVNNTTDRDMKDVKTTLTAAGLLEKQHTQIISVKAGGSASYELPLKATAVGEYTLTLSAVSGSDSDALELKLPVLVKGIDKQVNACGRLDATKTKATVTLDIPEARRPETTAFALHLSPGAAKNMVELLPYLAADDSGDIFGVVNRCMPALQAKIALQKLGVKWTDVAPEKTSRDKLYADYMERYSWKGNAVPVFTAKDFDRVIEKNLAQVMKMVNSDGGWGWFCAYREYSWPDTTAYVVDALTDLANAKYEKIPPNSLILKNGVSWLCRHADKRVREIKENKRDSSKGYPVCNTDTLVARVLAKAGKPNRELMDLCYADRVERLAPYGIAMLGLAYGKDSKEAIELTALLDQYLKVDDENGTAYLNIPTHCCWFWYGNENETLSAYLTLLLRNDPKSVKAQKVANYLVTNVRNSPWRNSCRSLGAAVRALANYIVVTGEGKPNFTVTVKIGSEEHKYTFNEQNLWQSSGPALFIPAEKLKSGKQTVELEFSGTGALYWNSMLNYFSLEDRIEPAGLEMKIQRNYFLLVQDKDATANFAGINGAVIEESVLKYKRVPLKDGDTVKPGDLIEVELVSTAKNDYDYVVFQDSMPAGFEYDCPISGWRWNWSAPMYVEFKERGAKFYLRNMARGNSSATYRIRAQLPGTVTALPAKGYGIYAPELKCNGAQQTLKTLSR